MIAASAGESSGQEAVHPAALECLRAHGVATKGLQNKGWGEFFGLGKPLVRFLISLDEVYASGANWSPDTVIASWPTPDPAALIAGEIDLQIAFEEAYGLLLTRIFQFLATRWESLSDRELSDALAAIGGPYD